MFPSISVVMSVYNGKDSIRDAVNSILSQSFKDFEFIIIDDGSTDGSADIVGSIKDERIILLRQINCGLSVALNNGIKISKAKFIARMDADDISLDTRLEKEYNVLKNNSEIGIVGTFISLINKDGSFIRNGEEPVEPEEIEKKILLRSCFNHGTVMFRKELWEMTGGYSNTYPENPPCEDYALWIKMLKYTKGYNIPEYLYKLVIHPDSVSVKNKMQQTAQHFLIAEKNLQEQLDNSQVSESKDKHDLLNYSLGELYYHNKFYKKSRQYLRKTISANPLAYPKAIRHLVLSYFRK
jgi:glycosyltransferase involved in cell wall biosynthesis